jgi:hypothetical protein
VSSASESRDGAGDFEAGKVLRSGAGASSPSPDRTLRARHSYGTARQAAMIPRPGRIACPVPTARGVWLSPTDG